jgi:xanthine dehydrogenase YagT iron-sulfur-binding subunit
MSVTHVQESPAESASSVEMLNVELRINGETRKLRIDLRSTLLDVLREQLNLTGAKKGCDQGQCGACTVLADGKRVLSCLSLAVAQQGAEITTIEGLADGDQLHPMQSAFMECDGFQCGYCTPGQIISAVALLNESANAVPSHVTPDVLHAPGVAELSDDEIRERMSGNICRCGAYPNIVDAVKHARDSQSRQPQPPGGPTFEKQKAGQK